MRFFGYSCIGFWYIACRPMNKRTWDLIAGEKHSVPSACMPFNYTKGELPPVEALHLTPISFYFLGVQSLLASILNILDERTSTGLLAPGEDVSPCFIPKWPTPLLEAVCLVLGSSTSKWPLGISPVNHSSCCAQVFSRWWVAVRNEQKQQCWQSEWVREERPPASLTDSMSEKMRLFSIPKSSRPSCYRSGWGVEG